jgi:hypothetical protein
VGVVEVNLIAGLQRTLACVGQCVAQRADIEHASAAPDAGEDDDVDLAREAGDQFVLAMA